MSAVEPGSRVRSPAIDLLVIVVLPAALVGAMYLLPFVREPHQLPFGADTFGYLWRTELVRVESVSALTPERTEQERGLGERPAHPVLVNLLRTATGATSLEVMWVLPAAISAAATIAAAGLALEVGERRGTAGLVGVGVASSAFIAQTAVGYGTNLMFDVIALSVGALAIRTATAPGLRDPVGGGFLLGAGALFHWIFAIVFAVLLAAYATVVTVARRIGRSRGGIPTGVAGRVALIVGVGVIVAAAGFAFASEPPGRLPAFGGGNARIPLRLPLFDLALTLPAAALGALVLLLVGGTRRWSLALLVPWAGLAAAGLISWFWLDLPTRPYRSVGFALGVPALIVLGALAVSHLRAGWPLRVASIVLAVGSVILLGRGGTDVWWHREQRYPPELFAQVGSVADYDDGLSGDQSLVLTYGGPPSPPVGAVRAGLPVELFTRIDFVKARGGVPHGGIVLHLDAINRGRPPDGRALAPGVTLLSGPDVAVEPSPVPRAPEPLPLVLLAAGSLLILMAAGSGWATGLTHLSASGIAAASPAFGMASIGLFGTIANRLGAPVDGAGGVALLASVTVAGWIVALVGRGPLMAFVARRRAGTADRSAERDGDRAGEGGVGTEEREVGLE